MRLLLAAIYLHVKTPTYAKFSGRQFTWLLQGIIQAGHPETQVGKSNRDIDHLVSFIAMYHVKDQ